MVKECFICGTLKRIHKHHIDWNHENSEARNKVWLCEKHHVFVHQVGYMGWEDLKKAREVYGRRQDKGAEFSGINRPA